MTFLYKQSTQHQFTLRQFSISLAALLFVSHISNAGAGVVTQELVNCDLIRGQRILNKCLVCHSIEEGAGIKLILICITPSVGKRVQSQNFAILLCCLILLSIGPKKIWADFYICLRK